MNRREFNTALAATAVWTHPVSALAQEPAFSRESVVALARQRAATPYQEPMPLPANFPAIGYDQYKDIQFDRRSAPFGGADETFSMDLMHAGFIFPHPVDLFLVENGGVKPIVYQPEMFTYRPWLKTELPSGSRLFAGFRLNAPMGAGLSSEEFVVFQGASYFRAHGRDQAYGLSARGLSIDSGLPAPEEFPIFTSFWIERPQPDDTTITVHALMDSPRVTGAFSFLIAPGDATVMDVEASLFPRAPVERYGLAPLTSMFLFNATNRDRFADFRWSVHDTDGLAIETADGEWLWRSFANPPKKVEFSQYATRTPKGFGLQQRVRDYDQYQDLEARYDLRTSLWVEPRGDWGDGAIELIELPSKFEFFDNIVAYWRPAKPLEVGQRLDYAYKLRWGPPVLHAELGTVSAARAGLTMDNKKRRLFVIDFELPERLRDYQEGIVPLATASAGRILGVSGRRNAATGGYRLNFEMEDPRTETVDVAAQLKLGGKTISETWLYRIFQD